MELHFLGKVTDGGNSPTLYDTSQIMRGRPVYVVQGWKVTDPQTWLNLIAEAVRLCAAAFEAVWALAIPHARYQVA